MRTYDALKVFERDGLKAIIQGEFKDLHSGTEVLVRQGGIVFPARVQTRGTGGITLVSAK